LFLLGRSLAAPEEERYVGREHATVGMVIAHHGVATYFPIFDY